MAKLTLSDVISRYGAVSLINANFDAIMQTFEKCLFRDGTSPNAMEYDLDMNSNCILNVDCIEAQSVTVNGLPVGATNITIQDDDFPIITDATTLNFTGLGVTVTDAGGGVAEVNIPASGGGSSLSIYDEGGLVLDEVTRINFTGAGVDATVELIGPNTVAVDIPGGGGGGGSLVQTLYARTSPNPHWGVASHARWDKSGTQLLGTPNYINLNAAASPSEFFFLEQGTYQLRVVVSIAPGTSIWPNDSSANILLQLNAFNGLSILQGMSGNLSSGNAFDQFIAVGEHVFTFDAWEEYPIMTFTADWVVSTDAVLGTEYFTLTLIPKINPISFWFTFPITFQARALVYVTRLAGSQAGGGV